MRRILGLVLSVAVAPVAQAWAAPKGGEIAEAALVGDATRIGALLAAGASPNAKNERGEPVLYLAAASGSADAVRTLLEAGAKVDATDKGGTTPLVIAATMGHTSAVRALLDGGAELLGIAGKVGALEMARREGHPETARVLEEATVSAMRERGRGDWIADLSAATLGSGDAPGAPGRLVVVVSDDATERRFYSSGGPSYSITYWMGDVDRTYAAAVAKALSAEVAPGSERNAGRPELRLVSFHHALLAHGTGTLPDVSDEITAKWKVFDASGNEVASTVFIGGKTEDTHGGLRGKQAKMAQERTLAALEDLYRKTVDGLAGHEAVERLGGE